MKKKDFRSNLICTNLWTYYLCTYYFIIIFILNTSNVLTALWLKDYTLRGNIAIIEDYAVLVSTIGAQFM